jgi:ribose transport system ATP-binding protein
MSELRLHGIVKRYGGVLALDQVDFSVHSGEVVCLLGENGAGKSTLANIVSGQVHRDAGDYFIDDEPVEVRTPASAHHHGIRTVPQELSLASALSVAENVLLGQLPAGRLGIVDRREMKRQAGERLAALSLGHLPVDKPVSSLRVVEQVFVQIARALTPGCRFLVADEPTAPMSSAEAETLLKVLESITNSGVGVVFVSHRLGEVLRIGHRVEVLRDGRNSLSSPVKALGRNDLVRAMIGDKELAPSAARHAETGTACLEVQQLSSGLLAELSLSVARGEIVGAYGGAGSGREDLGPAIFGAQARLGGQVSVEGKVVAGVKPLSSIRAGIAYVPAERRSKGLLLDRSIRDNITLGSLGKVSRFGVLRKAAEEQAAETWRERLDIKCRDTSIPVGSLSGGNQQKALLARWLVLDAPVLILDEPTRGVDVGTKAEIYQLLGQIAAQGTAVLVISSDAEELSTVCDRVLVLHGGVITHTLARPSEDQILQAAHADAPSSDHAAAVRT